MRLLLVLLTLPLLVHAKELETCYRIYMWLFPVAESCVLYRKEGDRMEIKSWARTVVVGRLVKPVNSWGIATLSELKAKSFALYQREGSFIRDHLYLFGEDGIEYRIIRYKKEGEEIKEGFFRSSADLFDPFSTSLLIYVDTPNFRGGSIPVFYEAKVQSVDYRTVGEEEVEVMGEVYDTWKVLLVPRIEAKGALRPKGNWYVWVDKETNIPVMLEISFTAGSAKVYLKSVRGDRNLLREVRDGQAGLF